MKCKYCKYYCETVCIGCGENRVVDGEDEGCTNYETKQEEQECWKE